MILELCIFFGDMGYMHVSYMFCIWLYIMGMSNVVVEIFLPFLRKLNINVFYKWGEFM